MLDQITDIKIVEVTQDISEVTKPYPLDAPHATVRSPRQPPVVRVELEATMTKEVADWMKEIARRIGDMDMYQQIVLLAHGVSLLSHRPLPDRATENLPHAATRMVELTGVRGWVVTYHRVYASWHIAVSRDEDGFRRSSPSYDVTLQAGVSTVINAALEDIAIIWKGWYSK